MDNLGNKWGLQFWPFLENKVVKKIHQNTDFPRSSALGLVIPRAPRGKLLKSYPDLAKLNATHISFPSPLPQQIHFWDHLESMWWTTQLHFNSISSYTCIFHAYKLHFIIAFAIALDFNKMLETSVLDIQWCQSS